MSRSGLPYRPFLRRLARCPPVTFFLRAPADLYLPRGALDVRSFFSHSTLEEKVRIIQRSEVDYVMVPADSSLDGSLKSQPGFAAMDTPVDAVERYNVYAVNRYRLN